MSESPWVRRSRSRSVAPTMSRIGPPGRRPAALAARPAGPIWRCPVRPGVRGLSPAADPVAPDPRGGGHLNRVLRLSLESGATSTRRCAWQGTSRPKPEFQKKLDWVDEFCREEVEPLDFRFTYAVRARGPEDQGAGSRASRNKIKDQGSGRLLDRDIGGPGFGQISSGSSTRYSAGIGSAPARLRDTAAPDTGTWRCSRRTARGADGALATPRFMNRKIFSATRLTEPQGGWTRPVSRPRRERRLRVGHQTARSGNGARAATRKILISDVQERDVRRARSATRAWTPAGAASPNPTSSTATYATRRPRLGPRSAKVLAQRSVGSVADGSTTRCAPSRSPARVRT